LDEDVKIELHNVQDFPCTAIRDPSAEAEPNRLLKLKLYLLLRFTSLPRPHWSFSGARLADRLVQL